MNKIDNHAVIHYHVVKGLPSKDIHENLVENDPSCSMVNKQADEFEQGREHWVQYAVKVAEFCVLPSGWRPSLPCPTPLRDTRVGMWGMVILFVGK